MKNKLIIILLILACLFPTISFANTSDYLITPLEPIPSLYGDETTSPDLAGFARNAFKFSIGIGAALAILMIVVGGFEYMGSESIGGKDSGKKKIQDALYGVLLLIFSYVLLNTINPDLLTFSGSHVTPESFGTETDVGRVARPTDYLPHLFYYRDITKGYMSYKIFASDIYNCQTALNNIKKTMVPKYQSVQCEPKDEIYIIKYTPNVYPIREKTLEDFFTTSAASCIAKKREMLKEQSNKYEITEECHTDI